VTRRKASSAWSQQRTWCACTITVERVPRVKRPTTSAARAKRTAKKVARAKRPTKAELPRHARDILRMLKQDYPVAVCELTHETPFQLLAATILSAQCTDARVNMVTPNLFAAYPDAASLAGADVAHVEEIVRSTGFYASKAKNLIGMATAVMTRFGGEVPTAIEDLVTLPGVGRKTANVLRSVAFDLPGLPVDTHVLRLSKRLGITREEDPVKVEMQLNALLPPAEWGEFSLRMILHGRRICDARSPRCDECRLARLCPSRHI
jgi:endonuclease-3